MHTYIRVVSKKYHRTCCFRLFFIYPSLLSIHLIISSTPSPRVIIRKVEREWWVLPCLALPFREVFTFCRDLLWVVFGFVLEVRIGCGGWELGDGRWEMGVDEGDGDGRWMRVMGMGMDEGDGSGDEGVGDGDEGDGDGDE